MSNIRLIVDSTLGIEKEYAIKNQIEIVSLKMILDGNVYEEKFEDSWESFYQKMSKSKNFPTTSQPAPDEFVQAINKIYSENNDAEIIILTISGKFSGTINSATLATIEFSGRKIIAVDTNSACLCGRLFVEQVIDLVNSGKSYEEILGIIPKIKEALSIQFIPDNMNALRKGGRIGALGATIANILKIKPIFQFKNGTLTVLKKVIGITKAINDMVSNISKKIKKMYICYIYNNENVSKLEEKVKELNICSDTKTLPVGPVFGVHVGIGGIGLAMLEEYN